MSDPKSVAAAQVAPSKGNEVDKSKTHLPVKPANQPTKPEDVKAAPKI